MQEEQYPSNLCFWSTYSVNLPFPENFTQHQFATGGF